jgi:DNA helicase-2/ATP-dependent DNA helicase PcrA
VAETRGKTPKKKFVLAPARRGAKSRPAGSTALPGRSGIDYAKALNPEQLAAATAPPGPVLVIAGAGTGKTRVITYRVAYLIEAGVKPEEILLLTFTNKAAREMMGRVEALVGASVHQVWGGTFHHIAHRILRQHAERLGYRAGYTILDREDARSLMRACIADRKGKAAGKAGKAEEKRFPQPQVLGAIHSLAVNTQTHAADLVASRYPHFAGRTDEILAVMRAYEERKRAANAMDYDDLLWNWLRLMEDDEFRTLLRARFRHVLVDEYQDTNRLQGELVDSLALPDRSITAVGDDAQAIYAWRGATPENILTFPERYPACRAFKLETNYRSTPEILSVANRALLANPRRFEKDLRPSRGPGPLPEVVPCRDAFQQSRFVAESILRMHEDGMPLEDIAVLYRSHWNALELQLEMQRRDIPFRVRGGIRFFEQAHIKDATAFLRAVANPRDEIAWFRALPLVPHVGPATTRALVEALGGLPDPIASLGDEAVVGLVNRKALRVFARFAEILRRIAQPAMREKPGEMIRCVVDDFYGDYLATRYANARLRGEDLAQLALYAGQFDSVESFLSDLALAGVVEAETSPVGPDEDRYVTLSTVHQAKGLEWKAVFVIWLADGRFPTDYAGKVEGGYEEERRLFHVAVTRARDELVLAYPMTYRWRGMDPVLMKRSRFLAELDEEIDGTAPPPCYEVVEIEEPAPEELDLFLSSSPRMPPASALETGTRLLASPSCPPAKASRRRKGPAASSGPRRDRPGRAAGGKARQAKKSDAKRRPGESTKSMTVKKTGKGPKKKDKARKKTKAGKRGRGARRQS